MRPDRRALAVALLLGVSSCATLSEAECHTVDWEERGVRDGAAGRPATLIFDYGKDCGKHGVTADSGAWREGYQRGLVSYCTAERGLEEGVRGGHYTQACPLESEGDFLRAFRLGQARRTVDQEIDQLVRDQRGVEARLLASDTPDAERTALREIVLRQDRYLIALRQHRDQLAGLPIDVDVIPAKPTIDDIRRQFR